MAASETQPDPFCSVQGLAGHMTPRVSSDWLPLKSRPSGGADSTTVEAPVSGSQRLLPGPPPGPGEQSLEPPGPLLGTTSLSETGGGNLLVFCCIHLFSDISQLLSAENIKIR